MAQGKADIDVIKLLTELVARPAFEGRVDLDAGDQPFLVRAHLGQLRDALAQVVLTAHSLAHPRARVLVQVMPLGDRGAVFVHAPTRRSAVIGDLQALLHADGYVALRDERVKVPPSGLAACREIVEGARGTLAVRELENGEVQLEVELPLVVQART